MHRFIIGVQFAGLFMAAIGLVSVAKGVVRAVNAGIAAYDGPNRAHHDREAGVESGSAVAGPLASRTLSAHTRTLLQGLAVALVGILILSPSWRSTWSYDRGGSAFIDQQRFYDQADGVAVDRLIRLANERGDGRVYAGTRANWGANFKVGFVPVLHMISHNDADGLGFTFRTVQSLTTDIEASFDDQNLAQFEMLNVRYVLMPSGMTPSVPHTEIAREGNSVLYSVQTTGYFQVVDRIGSISANRVNINSATSAFRASDQASRSIYPGVAFNGADPLPDTVSAPQSAPPGTVLSQMHERWNGLFRATVRADRRSVVLLKATFDPRWTVTVDGKRAKPVMMAPSLVGVEVEPGEHTVVFSYRSISHYPLLLALGAVTLLGLGQWRRRRYWWERLRSAGNLFRGAAEATR